MPAFETVLGLPGRLYRVFYSWTMRLRVSAWGRGSRIFPPATIVNGDGIAIGDGVIIREHAWLNSRGRREDGKAALLIGSGSYIGRFTHINAWSEVIIEPNVLISDRVYISDADHRCDDRDVPIRLQGDFFKAPVRLRSGCWIGVGAVILPGVTIGRNAIVAPNTVVRKDVPDENVVSGVRTQKTS